MTKRNVLYRFFNADGVLLYVGISMTPWERFRQHRGDKPWWDDIRATTMQPYPDRDAVLEAERAAIVAEKPLHNIQHNRSGTDNWCPTHDVSMGNCGCRPGQAAQVQPTGGGPFPAQQAVALCMADGNCHVGLITESDDTFVTFIHKEWMSGFYWGDKRSVRIADIVQVHYAEWDEPDPWIGNDKGGWRDDKFGAIQTAWVESHRRVGA